MPVKAVYPDLVIPDEDLWTYQFEQKSKPFADDKGTVSLLFLSLTCPK